MPDRRKQAAPDYVLMGAVVALAVALYAVTARSDRPKRAPARVSPRDSRARHDRNSAPGTWPGLWVIIKRVWRQMGEDYISALAAAVAFYAMLSIFPALTALVSLYGLVADPAIVQQQLNQLQGVLPSEAVSLLSGWLQALLQRPRSTFGTGLAVSLALSLWSARYATATMMTALNVAYDQPEARNVFWFNVVALALTLALVFFGIAVIALVAVLPAVIGLLPLPATWQSLVSLVRWPILAAVVILGLAALYRYAPNRAEPRWEWASAGALVGTALWLIGSVGFSLYVSRFASYDRTYGSLGAVIILLLWFWLGAYSVLAGAELNAVIGRYKRQSPAADAGKRGA